MRIKGQNCPEFPDCRRTARCSARLLSPPRSATPRTNSRVFGGLKGGKSSLTIFNLFSVPKQTRPTIRDRSEAAHSDEKMGVVPELFQCSGCETFPAPSDGTLSLFSNSLRTDGRSGAEAAPNHTNRGPSASENSSHPVFSAAEQTVGANSAPNGHRSSLPRQSNPLSLRAEVFNCQTRSFSSLNWKLRPRSARRCELVHSPEWICRARR
jgi:hypothetical protein